MPSLTLIKVFMILFFIYYAYGIKYKNSYKRGPMEKRFTTEAVDANKSQTVERSPWGIGYYRPPSESRMESGLPPEEEEEERTPPEGEFFVDSPEQDFIVPELAVGVHRGKEIGVGVQDGVLCVAGERPTGEDGYGYCRLLSEEDKKIIRRMASSESYSIAYTHDIIVILHVCTVGIVFLVNTAYKAYKKPYRGFKDGFFYVNSGELTYVLG